MKNLNQKQIKYLKGLGHKLSPVLWIGKEGASEGVLKQMAVNLYQSELIKVKVQAEEREDFLSTSKLLAEKSGSALVQTIGRVALYYLEAPEEVGLKDGDCKKREKIVLP